MEAFNLKHLFTTLPFLQIAVIILASRLCGILLVRLGQSRVIGEICVGVLLGPCLLLILETQQYALVFPLEIRESITTLGEIGLVLLMFQIGLRFDSSHLGRQQAGVAAFAVAAGGALLGFVLGALVGLISHPAIAPTQPLTGYILFCGIALSITALPVLVRIIADLEMEHSAAGTIGVAAAAMTDIFGWVLLASVVAWSSSAASLYGVALQLGGILLFLACARGLLAPLISQLGRLLATRGTASDEVLAMLMLVAALLCGWITTLLGLHGALGGLVAGCLLRGQRQHWQGQMEGFVNLALVPLYFASTGLKMDLGSLAPLDTWLWLIAFLAAAIFGKTLGCYVGGRLAGLSGEVSQRVAILMNTRGLMEIIVLSVGLDMGLISPTAFFLLLIVAIVTTLMTTPLVRRLGNVGSVAPTTAKTALLVPE